MSTLQTLAGILATASYVDLSPAIATNMPGWSHHPRIEVISDARTYERDGYFCQVLVMPEHTGSHVDAPAHIHPELADHTIDTVPVERLIAPAKKVDVRSLGLEAGDLLALDDFLRVAREQGVSIEAGDIALVQFGWDSFVAEEYLLDPEERGWWGANEPGFSDDLCEWLAGRRIRAIGTDTAGADTAVADGVIQSGFGHQEHFLPNDILVIEGLVGLSQVPASFLFLAIPLRIEGGSGSPLRAVGVIPA